MNAPLPLSAAAGPQQVFEAWARQQVQARQAGGRRAGFSQETADFYGFIWNAWCQWLAGRGDPHLADAQYRWLAVRPGDAIAFLDGPPPKNAPRPAKKTGELANFTRRTYWRVLRDVYAYAAGEGLRRDNPLVDVEPPAIAARDRAPQCVDPQVLRTLRDPQALCGAVTGGHQPWIDERDRAAIALVAHCGITARELQALKGHDVRLAPRSQPKLLGAEGDEASWLDVAGRSLQVPQEAVGLLHDWLDAREGVLQDLRDRAIAHARAMRAQPPVDALRPAHLQPLLIAREAPDHVPRPLTPASAHLIFSRVIKRLHEQLRERGQIDAASYQAGGPASVRNSVIKLWAREHGAAQAASWAGLKQINGRHA